ncbi:MAG: Rrf2 family transcriptional regulator [Roseburia faecis]|nr:Rrf2 family transcriptional regulator [Roseburia faecis]
MKDTKFAVAVHILTHAASSEEAVTSEYLANTINTNPSHIRKIMAMLKKAGLTDSINGRHGISLSRSAEKISFWDIFLAVEEDSEALKVSVYQKPGEEFIRCVKIRDELNSYLSGINEDVRAKLESTSLADFIAAADKR